MSGTSLNGDDIKPSPLSAVHHRTATTGPGGAGGSAGARPMTGVGAYGVHPVYLDGNQAFGTNTPRGLGTGATEMVLVAFQPDVDAAEPLKALRYELPTGRAVNGVPADLLAIDEGDVAVELMELPLTRCRAVVWDGLGWWFISPVDGKIHRRISGRPDLDVSITLVGPWDAVAANGYLWVTTTDSAAELVKIDLKTGDPAGLPAIVATLDMGADCKGIDYDPDTRKLFVAATSQGVRSVDIIASAFAIDITQALTGDADSVIIGGGDCIASDTGSRVYKVNTTTLALDETFVLGLSSATDRTLIYFDVEPGVQTAYIAVPAGDSGNSTVEFVRTSSTMISLGTLDLGTDVKSLTGAFFGQRVWFGSGAVLDTGSDLGDGQVPRVAYDTLNVVDDFVGSFFKVWRQPGSDIVFRGYNELFASANITTGSVDNMKLQEGNFDQTFTGDGANNLILGVGSAGARITSIVAPAKGVARMFIRNEHGSLGPVALANDDSAATSGNAILCAPDGGGGADSGHSMLNPGDGRWASYSPIRNGWMLEGTGSHQLYAEREAEERSANFFVTRGTLHRVNLSGGDFTASIDFEDGSSCGGTPQAGDRFGLMITGASGELTIDSTTGTPELIASPFDTYIPGTATGSTITIRPSAGTVIEWIWVEQAVDPHWAVHRFENLTGDFRIRPDELSANADDWNPADTLGPDGGTLEDGNLYSGTTVVQLTDDGSVHDITGLSSVGAYDGKVVQISNLGGYSARFIPSSSASLAANRLITPHLAIIIVPLGGTVTWKYNLQQTAWFLVASTMSADRRQIIGAVTTANDTPVNVATFETLADDTTIKMNLEIIARDLTNGDRATWDVTLTARRSGGPSTVSIRDTNFRHVFKEDLDWDVTFSVSSLTIDIIVKGDDTNSTNFECIGSALEVS